MSITFRQKILILLITCMCLSQMVTMAMSLVNTEQTIRAAVEDQLASATKLFDNQFNERYATLSDYADGLAGEYGFRSVLFSSTSGKQGLDAATVQSALENHIERFNADLAVYIDNESNQIISTEDISTWVNTPNWDQVLSNINLNDAIYSTVQLNDQYYQVVAAPVLAPLLKGWVMMGFGIDTGRAERFKLLSGLEISLFDTVNETPNDIISTLASVKEQKLIGAIQRNRDLLNETGDPFEVNLDNEQYLSRSHLIPGSFPPTYAVLQKPLNAEMQPYFELRNRLLLLFGFIILAAIAGSFFIGGSILSPVRRLALVAERIGQGNYGIEVQVENDDEIGRLGTTLNTMQKEIAQREKRIIYQSHHDDLTSLPNRYLVTDRISTAIHRCQRQDQKFILIMFDISRFKQINDTLGHDIGDTVLKVTAERLGKRQRKNDTFARMGGDDFLLLMENADLEKGLALLNKVIHPLLGETLHIDDVELNVKYNFGILEYPTHGEDAPTLLRRAEIALFEAKTRPSKVYVYESGRDESHIRELAIVSDLENAMAQDQLQMYYQPKLDLSNGDTLHAEALIRWIHPHFGFLPPDEFIGVLEQTGIIEKLTNWIIRRVAEQCRRWRDDGLDIVISINLSALDLINPDLDKIILEAIGQYEVPSKNIVLEITESAFMDDPGSARETLEKLRTAGLIISMDDFGTGYSSLAQLKSLPLDELKIDKSFVLNLNAESQDYVIVKSTIDLAHTLDLKVVAEGVETEEGLDILMELGCDKGQGYFFSKPLPADEFAAWQKANMDTFRSFTRETA